MSLDKTTGSIARTIKSASVITSQVLLITRLLLRTMLVAITTERNRSMDNLLTLECGHSVVTDVELRQQYPKDEHYVYCPPCRNPDLRVPTAWRKVIDNESLSDVSGKYARILPRDIMRLQPTVPRNRVRPFPYVKGFGRSDAGVARRRKG